MAQVRVLNFLFYKGLPALQPGFHFCRPKTKQKAFDRNMLPALSFVSQEKQIKGLLAVGNASTFNDFLRLPQFTPTPARISVRPMLAAH
ncbi:MAG: hypothetical protein ACI8SE_001994 [Bacteroidia bacterium]